MTDNTSDAFPRAVPPIDAVSTAAASPQMICFFMRSTPYSLICYAADNINAAKNVLYHENPKYTRAKLNKDI